MHELKNEGQRLLRLALPNRGDAANYARELQKHPANVSRYMSGVRPETDMRVRMFEDFGIPILSWDESPAESTEGDDAA